MSNVITLVDGGQLNVSNWPLPDGVEDGIFNRAQLATILDVSENTITAWLRAGMPAQSAGSNGTAYEFRLSHCWAWKSQRDEDAKQVRSRADQAAAQAALVFRNLGVDEEEEQRGLTASEVQAWAQAEYARNRAAEQRGQLVRVDQVSAVMDDILSAVRRTFVTLPDWMEMEFGLTPDQVAKAETYLLNALSGLQADCRGLSKPSGSVIGLDGRQVEMTV